MTLSNMPKGIRKRGNSYQVIVTKHSKQYSATCATLDEAIAKREALRAMLSGADEDRQASERIRLNDAIARTYSIKWEDTKGARTAEINAALIAQFFGPQTFIDQITTEKVNEFVQAQKARGSANSTINRKLSCLSVILQTAEELGYKVAHPTLTRRREYRGRDRFLTENEEQDLLTLLQLWGKDDHVLCTLIMLDTGMRIAEVLRLTSQDFDWSQGKYGVVNVWETKNNHPRTVPLTKRLADALKSADIHGALFKGCSQSWYRVIWDRARDRLGFTDDAQFVPHILRHTCASRLVKKGVPLAIVQKWMGHRSIQSTMRYAHLAPTALYEYVD